MTRSIARTSVLLLTLLGGGAACLVPAAPHDARAQEPPKGARDAPVERVYDLSGIRSAVWSLESAGGPRSVRPFGPSSAWMHGVEEPESQEPSPSIDLLIELAQSSLTREQADTTSMESVGDGTRVRVRTTAAGHDRIGALFETFRSDWGSPYEIDLRVVTLGDDAAAESLLADVEKSPRGRVSPELSARLLAADARRGVRGATVFALPGRWAQVESVRETRVATDFDVEIAESASIADPRVHRVEEGLRAALRACPLSDGRAVIFLAVATGDIADLRRFEMRTKDLGALELPDVSGALAVTETTLAAGEATAVALSAPTTTDDASRYVAVLRLVAVPVRSRTGDLAILPTGALCAPRPRPAIGGPEGDVEDVGTPLGGGVLLRWLEEESQHHLDALTQQVQAGTGDAFEQEGTFLSAAGDWPGGGALVVRAPPATIAKVASILADVERESLATAWTSLRLVETPPETIRGEDALRSGRTVAVLAGPVLPGGLVVFGSYRSTAYLGDYDVEVAQSARIADPFPLTATGGVVARLRLARAVRGGWRVDVSLRATATGAVELAPVQATEVGVVERVPVRKASFAGSVVLAPGTVRAVDLGESPWRAPGTTRLWAVFRVE